MSEKPVGRMVDVVRDTYHVLGETPAEVIWDGIQRAMRVTPDEGVIDLTVERVKRSVRVSRPRAWFGAAAALLVLGVGSCRVLACHGIIEALNMMVPRALDSPSCSNGLSRSCLSRPMGGVRSLH